MKAVSFNYTQYGLKRNRDKFQVLDVPSNRSFLPREGAFNHVDKKGWVGGLKFAIFVHVYYIKNVHQGRWVVKKEQKYVHVVIEFPLI